MASQVFCIGFWGHAVVSLPLLEPPAALQCRPRWTLISIRWFGVNESDWNFILVTINDFNQMMNLWGNDLWVSNDELMICSSFNQWWFGFTNSSLLLAIDDQKLEVKEQAPVSIGALKGCGEDFVKPASGSIHCSKTVNNAEGQGLNRIEDVISHI